MVLQCLSELCEKTVEALSHITQDSVPSGNMFSLAGWGQLALFFRTPCWFPCIAPEGMLGRSSVVNTCFYPAGLRDSQG